MNAGCDEERNPNSQICHDCQNDLRNVTLATGTARFNTDDLFCDELAFQAATPLVDPDDVVMDSPVVAAAAMLDLQGEANVPVYTGAELEDMVRNTMAQVPHMPPRYHGP